MENGPKFEAFSGEERVRIVNGIDITALATQFERPVGVEPAVDEAMKAKHLTSPLIRQRVIEAVQEEVMKKIITKPTTLAHKRDYPQHHVDAAEQRHDEIHGEFLEQN